MSTILSPSAEAAARTEIDSRTSGPSPGIPGLVYCAVNKDGEIIFSHASGKTGLGNKAPMTLDTTFWIASCTKLITSIAVMQLVEKGKISLDDSSQIESLAPELRDVRVLERAPDGDFRLVEKDRAITMRMLLCHTCEGSKPKRYFVIVVLFS